MASVGLAMMCVTRKWKLGVCHAVNGFKKHSLVVRTWKRDMASVGLAMSWDILTYYSLLLRHHRADLWLYQELKILG